MHNLINNCTFGLKTSLSPRNTRVQANVYTSCLLPSDELTKFKNVRHSCGKYDIFKNLQNQVCLCIGIFLLKCPEYQS
jgi:hypothetical protein